MLQISDGGAFRTVLEHGDWWPPGHTVGWGDTYLQTLPGQSFDITDLPNGTYYISVQANPTGALYERDSSNDVQLRQVTLSGAAGHRRAIASPWHGITQ